MFVAGIPANPIDLLFDEPHLCWTVHLNFVEDLHSEQGHLIQTSIFTCLNDVLASLICKSICCGGCGCLTGGQVRISQVEEYECQMFTKEG